MSRQLSAAFWMINLCIVATSAAQSPVGWRGDASGRFPNATPPTQWSPTENVVWKTEMPGRSFGSPVVVDDRVFVVSDPAELLCVRASDGEILWRGTNSANEVFGAERGQKMLATWSKMNDHKKQLQREYNDLRKSKPDAKEQFDKLKAQIRSVDEEIKEMKQKSPVPENRGSGNTAATVVCDGKHVYAAFGTGIVAAYDLNGRPQWFKFIEGSALGFGHASSPVLVDGKLIVHFHDLVALDISDGEIVWRTELAARHATSIAVRFGKHNAILSPSGSVVRASDGEVLLEDKALRVSEGSPIVHDGVVYAQAAQTSAFRLPPSPRDATEMELLWQATASRGRRTPSPVWHDGLMYGVTTNGILDVTDTKTGEVVYRKRLDIGNNVYSSATSAGDYIFLSSTRGDTIVLKAGREYDEVARNKLESFGSNLVFAGKRMYVRGQKHLYCIGE